jgi:glycosyltransferase involved in cell wall biosynthesis
MKASVVVPTFNRRKTLERTLRGLFDQSVDPDVFEIVVVDDHSEDDTLRALEMLRASHRNLRYLRHDENRGRVITRNDGIVASHGDVVIFLDDDNVPCQSFVEVHLECHRRAHLERVAIVGNASFASECIARSNFGRYVNAQYLGNRIPSRRRKVDYSNLPAKYFGTLNASVRRDDAVRVGMFDRAFRYYGGEDFYFGHRLRQAGVRIAFCEEARSTHYDDVTLRRYKLKSLEAAREGLSTIAHKDAAAMNETELRHLMPVAWRAESLSSILKKCVVQGALNRPALSALEWWARATDRWPILAWNGCYRALFAGWYLRGFRSKVVGRGEVTYGDT